MSRNYLEAFIVIIIAAALGFFLVWPKYGQWQEIGQKIEDKTAEIKNRQNYYANLEQISADFSQYAANLKKIETALPVEMDAPALMSFAQAAAMQSGLIIKKIDYQYQERSDLNLTINNSFGEGVEPQAGERLVHNYSISLELAGTYDNFKDFISRVERSSRLIEISMIGIDAKKKDNTQKEKEKSQKETDQTNQIINYAVQLSANYYK